MKTALLRASDRLNDHEPTAPIAEELAASLAQAGEGRSGDVACASAAEDALRQFLAVDEGGSDALSTGFPKIDRHLGGGLRRGALYVLAARPGIGKSALALHLAHRAACSGHPVAFASLEMDAAECAGRLLTAISFVQRAYEKDCYDDRHRAKLRSAADDLRGCPITFMETREGTIDGIAAFLARENLRAAPRLLVVDYLQLVSAPGHDNRVNEVGAVSRRLKLLAMQHAIPVLALSQLSRALEVQQREPRLSDLRDSGGIEADADCVFLLSRVGEAATTTDLLKVRLAKNRSGPPAEEKLNFKKTSGTFEYHQPKRLSEDEGADEGYGS